MHSLGIELLSAAYFTYPVENSIYEHTIIIDIELKRDYPTLLLGELLKGWKWYTQTVTDDHWPLLVLGYSETFVWSVVLTVEDRVQQIIKAFEDYLGTRDPKAVRAILMLMGN